MFPKLALLALSFLAVTYGQQAGTLTTETHPALTWQTCSSSGCTTTNGKVVLDKYYSVDSLLLTTGLDDVEIELSGTRTSPHFFF